MQKQKHQEQINPDNYQKQIEHQQTLQNQYDIQKKQVSELPENKFYTPQPTKPKDYLKKSAELGLKSDRFVGYANISDNAKEKIERIKLKDRTYLSLDGWEKSSYAYHNWTQQLKETCPQEIETIDYKDYNTEKFAQEFMSKKSKPVLINNMYSQQFIDKHWTFQSLYDSYKEAEFKCGEDDDGKKLRIKLKYYLEYLLHNKDDSPLYLFESSVEDNKEMRNIITKYDVPKYFQDDLFKYTGENKRPPYRWFLIGPERSGTTVHQDPLATDAWNTSFIGYKRWVCFPKHIPKAIVKGKQYKIKGEDDESIMYFCKMLPQIIQNEGRKNLDILEFIQGPGQTVYVPGGWWHAVINVSDTIAVTQNVMSRYNLENVWRSVRCERKKFSCYLLKKLKKHLPEQASRCEQLNKTDNFIMYDEEKTLLKKRSQKELEELNFDDIQKLEILKKKKKYSIDSSDSSSSSSSSSKSRNYESTENSYQNDTHKQQQNKN